MGPRLSLIVAMADNRVIGRNGKLPWRQKSDLQHFRMLTWGKPVIMGRKTFDSIGQPLEGRTNIILSREVEGTVDEAVWANSFSEAVEKATNLVADDNMDEIMVIGGENVFRQALASADRIYLTEIHSNPDGDTFMPPWDEGEWVEMSRRRHPAGPDDTFDFSFVLLERKKS